MKKHLFAFGLAVILSSCAANPATLYRPLTAENAPRGEFFNSTGGVVTETLPDGTVKEKIVDVDKVGISNIGSKDTANLQHAQTYYDTTQMPIQAMTGYIELLRYAIENDVELSSNEILIIAGGIDSAANYEIPQVMQTQTLTLDRTNDGEAYYAAEQFRAEKAKALAEIQTLAMERTTGKALDTVQSMTPAGAAKGAFDVLAEAMAGRPESTPTVEPDSVE